MTVSIPYDILYCMMFLFQQLESVHRLNRNALQRAMAPSQQINLYYTLGESLTANNLFSPKI